MIDFHQLSQLIIPVAHAAEETAPTGIASLGFHGINFLGQLVNFLILLFIFWKFILPGVTKGLKERTDRIEKSLFDADRIEKEKKEFETWKNSEMTKARTEASSIVTSAQTEAGKAKQAILDQTKLDQQKLVDQAKLQIESEKNKALQDAKGELADLVTNATEKILRHKLDAKTDQALIKESLQAIK
jgi:F-type H+-transporting ATPase subunit b